MTSHTSLLETQVAATTLLRSTPAFTSLCQGPFNPPPENQPFPYAAWGAHIEVPRNVFGGKFGKDVVLILDIFSQSFGFLEALQILDAVNGVLDNATLSLTNFYNIRTLFEQSMQLNDPDGITRHIIARYRVWNMAL